MQKNNGHVSLVGAGPGEPGLITVKGMQHLANADVVVFDALANPVLLDSVSDYAELIDVGKRAKNHKMTQDEINDVLVSKAREGKFVVRLKGGDPYLFGRGAEEAIYLAERGVSCEIVPGVTSGIAAPGAAGIPVTFREISSTVTFVTGHEDPTKDKTAVDYGALAGMIRAGGTVCFYMGVGRLELICDTLHEADLPKHTPIALVQWGTHPKQRRAKGTLGDIVQTVKQTGISSPAIIVVGDVVGLEREGLDYFMNRPLFGKKIIVTRTRQQVSVLRDQLAALGAEVLEAPTIEIEEPESWDAVDDAIKKIGAFDWLLLTSVNGVKALAERLDAVELDARHLAGVKIAAIGDATERALQQDLNIRADLVPTRYIAESLAGELIAEHGVSGRKVLLLRADIARPALPQLLTEAGAEVTELVAYETKRTDQLPADVINALENNDVDWVTFTSSSTVQNMVELLGNKQHLLDHVKVASIGSITTETANQLNVRVDLEAKKSNIDGLVSSIVKYVGTN
ncbi:Uroporphyrinogen-III C-methyltransferase [Poriferisphaera corsica]|uniref:uroporphyrinogen-III C-methyltransferase n=1 Tax=Poriferisphaera corsica TaxID=2528020 RepID=A0A517YUE7_9BACT|nr:uroporphyrinogen-III C-methyltransferase [Poriferisphaera corsica]QDU33792.1 Uroporphyrinogen-III C-methyltransferase [Poriferisphaera corsica]